MDVIAAKGIGTPIIKKKLRHLFWRFIAPLPDKPYLFLKYISIYGRKPDFTTPQRFSELQQIRKMTDRNPLYPIVVDKAAVKDYVTDRAGAQYIIPTYWVGTDLGEVDWSTIPLPAVVKPTHASAQGYFLKSQADVEELMRLRPEARWLAIDHSRINREWAYETVPPRIIIEKMLENDGQPLKDYRFFTFKGHVKHIEIRTPYKGTMHEVVYSPDWQRQGLHMDCYPLLPVDIPRPEDLDELLSVAAKLGRELSFARIDLYNTVEGIFSGEITLYPSGGFEHFVPDQYDFVLGSELKQAQG